MSAQQQLYLAVFLGSKNSAKFAAWNALAKARRYRASYCVEANDAKWPSTCAMASFGLPISSMVSVS